jgi:hypothetical protein
MNSALRRLNLTAHVASSVGWLGAVVAFLALSIAGRTSADAEIIRASYVAMNLIGQFIIVPLSILALSTGVVQSLGTHWGLVRYYWVLTKFVLTVGATLLLLLHQFTAVAGAATAVSNVAPGALPDVGRLSAQLVFDAAFAGFILVVTTTLSVYKPWGRIQRVVVADAQRVGAGDITLVAAKAPLGLRIVLIIAGLFVATVVALHLSGHGLGHHGM